MLPRRNKFSGIIFFIFFLITADKLFSQEEEKLKINALIDNWHHAAAVADEDAFFGFMSEECIYLGTDINEKWLRDELKAWSEKYFNTESAWSFTAFDREIYLHDSMAWFDEKLNTWMGPCRASGILKNEGGQWKLLHYQLSVAVPNEKIKDFIEMVKKE